MDIDKLVKEEFVLFREKAIDAFIEKHPHLFSIANTFLSGKQSKMGMQVTENGKIAGEYTIHLDGIRISGVDSGNLSSEIRHPFLGIVRPYVVIESSTLERITKDEGLLTDLLATLPMYLPEITIKFLR